MSNNKTYTGFEAWKYNLKMSLRMRLFILLALTAVYLGFIAAYILLKYDAEEIKILAKWAASAFWAHFLPKYPFNIIHEGEILKVTAARYYEIFYEIGIEHINMLKTFAVKSLLVYLGYFPAIWFFKKKANEHSAEDFRRGAEILTPKQLNKLTKKEKCYLKIGEINMPASAENKHCFIVGRPGTGKTVLTSALIEQIRARGDKAVIYDFKGDYVSRFYDPEKDLLFNPLDSRSVRWNIFADMHTPMDIISMTSSLIPELPHTSQPFFNLAAKDVLNGAFSYLYSTNRKNYAALWEVISKAPEELSEILKNTKGGTAGAIHIADPANKQTGSVMSTLHLYSKIFEYMQDSENGFSIGDWIKNGSGILFISNYAELKETLRPILTVFIDTIARNLLAQPENTANRLFLMIDEFGTLQKMQKIIELLNLSRSKGGAVFLGIQDIGQIDNIYGKELRSSIINACGTNVIFGVNDPDTADFLSRKIGDREYKTPYSGFTVGSADERNALSLNKQRVKEPLMISSEIMQLPDLKCYVRFPNFSGSVTTLKPKSYMELQPSFLMRPDLSLDNIFLECREILSELNLKAREGKGAVEIEKF